MKIVRLISVTVAVFAAATAVAATPKPLELVNGTSAVIAMDYEPKIICDQSGAVIAEYIPQAKKLVILGKRFGDSRVHLMDKNGVRDIYDVKVIPANWQLYRKIVEDSPNIRLEPGSGKILVSGTISSPADVEVIKKLQKADEKLNQIVDNTVMDSKQISIMAEKFLKERKFENITLTMLNKVVFISGEVYDEERRKQVIGMLTEYFKTLDCTVNTAGLNITSRKIAMKVIFLDVDKSKLRQAGIKVDSPIQWSFAFKEIANYFSIGDSNQGVHLNAITGQINIMQENNVAKVVYENQLATLSGVKAQFQQGGVLNVRIYSQYNTDLKEIEYGFQVEATPYTIDRDTIGLDFEMSQIRPKNENSWTKSDTDKDLSKYLTKSKYTMTAGTGMVISSIAINGISDKTSGLPWLSELPWLGTWLFGSTSAGANDHELLLILVVDWEDNIRKAEDARLQTKNGEIDALRKDSKESAVKIGR